MLRIGMLFACLVYFATASAAKTVSGEIQVKKGKLQLPNEQTIKQVQDGSKKFLAGQLSGIEQANLEVGIKQNEGADIITFKITIPEGVQEAQIAAILAEFKKEDFKAAMAKAVTDLGMTIEAADIIAVTAKVDVGDASSKTGASGTVIMGAITLTGVDFKALAEAARNSLKDTAATQIAAVLDGITKDHVKITLPSRRLSEARRLADTKLTYAITMPEGAKVTADEAMAAVKGDAFKQNFATEASKIDGISITKEQLKVSAMVGLSSSNNTSNEDATERLSVLAVLLASVGWILS